MTKIPIANFGKRKKKNPLLKQDQYKTLGLLLLISPFGGKQKRKRKDELVGDRTGGAGPCVPARQRSRHRRRPHLRPVEAPSGNQNHGTVLITSNLIKSKTIYIYKSHKTSLDLFPTIRAIRTP